MAVQARDVTSTSMDIEFLLFMFCAGVGGLCGARRGRQEIAAEICRGRVLALAFLNVRSTFFFTFVVVHQRILLT